jgi:hypothetical protein
MGERRPDADDLMDVYDRLYRPRQGVSMRRGSGGTGGGTGGGGTSDGTAGAIVVEEDAAVVVATATNINFEGSVAVVDDGNGHATVTIGTAATGRYRALVYDLDGAGGFEFLTDLDGHPIYELADLE